VPDPHQDHTPLHGRQLVDGLPDFVPVLLGDEDGERAGGVTARPGILTFSVQDVEGDFFAVALAGTAAAKALEGDAAGDLVEPGAEARLHTEAVEAAEGAQEGLLDEVRRQLAVKAHMDEEARELGRVATLEDREHLLASIAVLPQADEGFVGRVGVEHGGIVPRREPISEDRI